MVSDDVLEMSREFTRQAKTRQRLRRLVYGLLLRKVRPKPTFKVTILDQPNYGPAGGGA